MKMFRRREREAESYTAALRGLDPEARYRVFDFDHPEREAAMTGTELAA